MFFNLFTRRNKAQKVNDSVHRLDLAYQNALKHINIMNMIMKENNDKQNIIRLRQAKLSLQVTFNRALLKLGDHKVNKSG
ncbi:MAG: hypothetical protein CME70_18790 [Halobacteriovorax sp.]|nr:hypothetical protein [Halobacteriovorax sp.]